MYGKIFVQIYEGSLYGHWEALVTFQQMIVLADSEGIVDMTPSAIAARTSIPVEIIQRGIALLEAPDPESRTPDEEGRRIIRLSDDRSWGWTITNFKQYRAIRSLEERREYMRLYQRARRARAKVNTPSTPVNDVTHAVGSTQYAVDKKALGKPSKNGEEPILILAKIKALAVKHEVPGRASQTSIPRSAVEGLGAKAVAAFDAVGGSQRIVTQKPEDWGFLVNEFSKAYRAS